jgi:hypothetical protein
MTDLASVKRLTTARREYVQEDETMDPHTAQELVRIFDLIDRILTADRAHVSSTPRLGNAKLGREQPRSNNAPLGGSR